MRHGRITALLRLVLASLGLLLAACSASPSPPHIVQLVITPRGSALDPGEHVQLRAIGHFDDGKTADLTDLVLWNSAGPAVATVSARGRVTAVAGGRVSITAYWYGAAAAVTFDVTWPWNGDPLLSVPRAGAAMVQEPLHGDVLVFGGMRYDNGIATPTRAVDRYLPATQTWLADPDMPADCGEPLAASYLYDTLLVCGGSAWSYSHYTRSWRALPSPAADHAGGQVLIAGGPVYYLVGGRNTTVVERYDTYSWETIGNLSQQRSDFAADFASDYPFGSTTFLVVAGGAVPSGPYNVPVSVDTVDLYDLGTGAWSTTTLGTPRSGHRMINRAEGLQVVGGVTWTLGPTPDQQAATVLASAEVFAAGTRTWSPGPVMATARHDFAMVSSNNVQWRVFGGTGSSGVLAAAEAYDPADQAWSPLPALRVARTRPAALWLSDGTVLVAGGIDGNGNSLATVEILH